MQQEENEALDCWKPFYSSDNTRYEFETISCRQRLVMAANGWSGIEDQALPIAARREVTHPDDLTPKPVSQIHVNPDPAVRGNLTRQHDEQPLAAVYEACSVFNA